MASQVRYTLLVAAASLLISRASWAQEGGQIDSNIYDDYSAFESDPVQLDEEVSRYFGRFFETNFLFGTGLFTGELGQSNSAGLNLGLRFVFYFDKMWAGELGAGYYSHKSFYNPENTGKAGVSIDLDTVLIPIALGLRYAFDRENLPRGISLMNPYLAIGGELIFRAEGVAGSPVTTGLETTVVEKFQPGAVINTTAYGMQFGGGFEFDVYKNKVFLGLDLRYHLLFWSDSDVLVGKLGRSGNYVTIHGMASYNY